MSEMEVPRHRSLLQDVLEIGRFTSQYHREIFFPTYKGPNRAIWGSIRKGNSYDTFRIHFTPRIGHIMINERITDKTQRVLALKQGKEDLLDFMNRLQTDPKFQRVELIEGTTNYAMARFAIRRLGFQISHSPDDPRTDGQILEDAQKYERLPRWKQRMEDVFGGRASSAITVRISRDELLAQHEQIQKMPV